jgi:hypothetical protein
MNRDKVGAAYCVYEDSGTLNESIRRIYSLVDHVLILLSFEPWNGVANIDASLETYKKASEIYDPDNKVTLISKCWKNEAEQRNFGKGYLHNLGIKWCFIIDDDEFYNHDQLQTMIEVLQTSKMFVYLIRHQIYWKSREYCIDGTVAAMPAFVLSDNAKTIFRQNRNVEVLGGNWDTPNQDDIVCHHFSYVRTNEQLLRKIATFSHANDYPFANWYENIWLPWTLASENLHPSPESVSVFRRAIPVAEGKYQLEKTGFSRELETLLASTNGVAPPSDLAKDLDEGRLLVCKLYKVGALNVKSLSDNAIREALVDVQPQAGAAREFYCIANDVVDDLPSGSLVATNKPTVGKSLIGALRTYYQVGDFVIGIK